jgi:hypothetical protein
MARWRVKPGRILALPDGRVLTAGEEVRDGEVPDEGRYLAFLERVPDGEPPLGTHRSMHGRDGRPDYPTRKRG